MKKNYQRPEEEVRAEQRYSTIQRIVLLAAACLFFMSWKYALVALGVYLWNGYFYEKGRDFLVVDEYEYDGYPQEGLRAMFRSWLWLGGILLLLYFFILR